MEAKELEKRAQELNQFLTDLGVSLLWFLKIVEADRLTERELEDLEYLDDRIQSHLEDQGVEETNTIMYEDDLPKMSDIEYAEWFRTSKVDGVRVGRTFICVGAKLINLLERE